MRPSHMWACALTVLFGGAGAQASEHDPAADEWFGHDKALHFGASAGLALAGYGASAFIWEEPGARLLAGGALALSLGVAKELYDLSGAGHASWKDLTWDVAGTGAGLLVAWMVDQLLIRPLRTSQKSQGLGASSYGLGLSLRF